MSGIQVHLDQNDSLLSTKDVDKIVFAVQARTQKLFVVEKPMVRKQAAEYIGVSPSTFDKLARLDMIPKHYIPGLDIPFFLPSEIYHLIKSS